MVVRNFAVQRRRPLALLRQTLREVAADRVPVLAASLAYCSALSLAPLVIVTLFVAGTVVDRDMVQAHVVQEIDGLLGESGGGLITQVANQKPASDGGTFGAVAGAVMLVFGATAVFVQLQDGLNIIWDVEPKPGRGLRVFVRRRLVSLAMVMSLGFLLLVSLLASSALSALAARLSVFTGAEALTAAVLSIAVSLVGTTGLLALLFRYVPDARTGWRAVLTGAAVTAILLHAGEWALGEYFGRAHVGSAYGAAGSLVLLLVWVYYSSVIVFTGAEFTQVLAASSRRGVVPAAHSKRGNRAAPRGAKRASRKA